MSGDTSEADADADVGSFFVDDVDETWSRIESTQEFVDPPVVQGASKASSSSTTTSPSTRLVIMSDTHGMHRHVGVFAAAGASSPPCYGGADVLIHAGDFTKSGEPGTIRDLDDFFRDVTSSSPLGPDGDNDVPRGLFRQVICIAGNHDITFHESFYRDNWNRFHLSQHNDADIRASLRHCTYLEDSGCTIGGRGGIEVYGSPWTPEFCDWAFNLPRGEPLKEVWSRIPSSTDVLITHGPPLGRGDRTSSGGHRSGCHDLLQHVQNRIRPRVHVFGHIHEARGITFDGHTLFVNASNVDLRYRPVHPCIVIDVPHDKNKSASVVNPVCTLKGNALKGWLRDRGYTDLAAYAENVRDEKEIPSGNALLEGTAHLDLCQILLLHRDRDARQQLQRALMQLYAESFAPR